MNTKTVPQSAGIYLDHASAHLVEYINGTNESKLIDSKFTHVQKEQALEKSEKAMHNKEDREHADYYKKIGEAIRKYDFVLLFGPTEAKAELLNILKADHRFDRIRIEVRPSDKMTETQIHTFVRNYFANH